MKVQLELKNGYPILLDTDRLIALTEGQGVFSIHTSSGKAFALKETHWRALWNYWVGGNHIQLLDSLGLSK